MITLITTSRHFYDEPEIINKLFLNGLDRLHLRKLNYSREDYVELLKNIDNNYHSKIIVSHYQDLMDDFCLGGIHFNEIERKEKKHLLFNDYDCIKTTSFHNVKSIFKEKFNWDYYYLSPFFNSISKPDLLQKKFDITFINRNKTVPLGGVNNYNIQTLKFKGFSNIGVSGFVWESEDPLVKFSELYELDKM